MSMQRFGDKPRKDDRRQDRQRRHGDAEVVRHQTEFAGVRRQPALVVHRVPNGMRPCRQLGEEENGNEKEMAQRIHGLSLTQIIH